MATIEDKYVGNRLKLRRIQLGITQAQLGKFVDFTFRQVQNYENGTTKINAVILYRFAKILHVRINYFFDGIEDGVDCSKPYEEKDIVKRRTSLDNEIMSYDMKILNKAFSKINSSKERHAVISVAKALSNPFNNRRK